MSELTDAIEQMHASLKDLHEQDARLSREQQLIAQQRDAVANEINNLEITIRYFDEYGRRTNHAAPRQTHAFPTPIGGTIADTAVIFLDEAGGAMEFGELHDALRRAGKLKPSPHSKTTLWKTLNRKSDTFARAGDGKWRLVGRVGEHLADDHPKVTVMTR